MQTLYTFESSPVEFKEVYKSFHDMVYGPDSAMLREDPTFRRDQQAQERFMQWCGVLIDVAVSDGRRRVQISTSDVLVAWHVRNMLACQDALFREYRDGVAFYGNPFAVPYPEMEHGGVR